MIPSTGRIVMYRLTQQNVDDIAKRREPGNFTGNNHQKGDVVPLIVTKVWPEEYTGAARLASHPADTKYESAVGVNGQAILDGNDSMWVTSAPQHTSLEGGWYWPVIEKPAKTDAPTEKK